jgi:hypothetical protein
VHHAKATAATGIILNHLARQDVSKSGESIIQHLVVDVLVQVLDEDVSNTRATDRWITLGPHDADGLASHFVKVALLKGATSVNGIVKVHVGVAQ